MKAKKAIIILSMAMIASGCATKGTQTKLNNVSVGMTKLQVVEALGRPDSAAATEGTEYLVYQLTGGTSGGTAAACGTAGVLTLGLIYLQPQCRGGKEDDFFVRLRGGRVDAYGKVGDFDSTKTPEATLNVNNTTNTQSN